MLLRKFGGGLDTTRIGSNLFAHAGPAFSCSVDTSARTGLGEVVEHPWQRKHKTVLVAHVLTLAAHNHTRGHNQPSDGALSGGSE